MNKKKLIIFISLMFGMLLFACLITDVIKGEVGYSIKNVFVTSKASATNKSSKDKKTENSEDNSKHDMLSDSKTAEEPKQETQEPDAAEQSATEAIADQPETVVDQTAVTEEVQPVVEPPTEVVEVPAEIQPEAVVEPVTEQAVTPQRYAYLTFDDGPSDNTLRILDILDLYGVKATFFVAYHEGYDDYYRQIVNRGHTIALHTYSHKYNQIYASEQAYYDDLNAISAHIATLTGVSPKILRFPGGSSNGISRHYCPGIMTALINSTQANGYIFQDWNVDSMDASVELLDKDSIVNNVLTASVGKNNSYILMHDTSAKTTTPDALPQIIEGLVGQGYSIIQMTELTPPCHHSIINN